MDTQNDSIHSNHTFNFGDFNLTANQYLFIWVIYALKKQNLSNQNTLHERLKGFFSRRQWRIYTCVRIMARPVNSLGHQVGRISPACAPLSYGPSDGSEKIRHNLDKY